LGQTTLFKKFGISLETPVLGLKTAVSKNSELTKFLEFGLFQTFRKLQKNDVKLVPTLKPTRTFDLKFGMQGLTREGDGYVMLGYFNKVQLMLPIKLGTFQKKSPS